MNDEEVPQRRKTDGVVSHWAALTISTLMALGGTAAFTFHVYDALRAELARIGLIEPTLLAHIEADRELQRLCQERVDYLEQRIDRLRDQAKK